MRDIGKELYCKVELCSIVVFNLNFRMVEDGVGIDVEFCFNV